MIIASLIAVVQQDLNWLTLLALALALAVAVFAVEFAYARRVAAALQRHRT